MLPAHPDLFWLPVRMIQFLTCPVRADVSTTKNLGLYACCAIPDQYTCAGSFKVQSWRISTNIIWLALVALQDLPMFLLQLGGLATNPRSASIELFFCRAS